MWMQLYVGKCTYRCRQANEYVDVDAIYRAHMSREQLGTDDNADADWHLDVYVNRDLKEATKKKDPEEPGGPTRGTSHTWARDFPDSKKKNKDPEAPGGQTRGTSHTWARDFPDSKKKNKDPEAP